MLRVCMIPLCEFLLDFYKNWNNFTGKLWLYFFLLIYVKAMTLLAFIVLEGNNVLLRLCRQRSSRRQILL